MLFEALVVVSMAAGAVQDGDTTFAARSANSLDVEVGMGVVVVRGWGRNEVRVQSGSDLKEAFEIELHGDRVTVESELTHLFGGSAHLEIDVPVRFDVSVEGLTIEVHIQDTDGDVDVESLSGDVTVLNSRGDVQVESMAGGIRVEDSEGDLDLTTAGFAVQVRGATGDIQVETIGGPIDLVDVRSAFMEITSLGGHINFEGAFLDGGTYYFESHGGPIDLVLAPGANATFEMDTMMGDVDVEYPGMDLQSSRRQGKRFVVGDGGAEVEIETFSGRVRIRERGRR